MTEPSARFPALSWRIGPKMPVEVGVAGRFVAVCCHTRAAVAAEDSRASFGREKQDRFLRLSKPYFWAAFGWKNCRAEKRNTAPKNGTNTNAAFVSGTTGTLS